MSNALSDRKKVVFVLSGYGRYARGAERMVADLAVRLADAFDISVLGSGADAPFAVPLDFLSRDNPWTRLVNRTPVAGHVCRTLQFDPLNWEWMGCALAARRWLERNPCDLLVPEGGRWGGWLGNWCRGRFGTPFIDIAQGAPSRWEVAAAKWLPDRYVSVTEWQAGIMRKEIPGLNVQVIPNGVDTNAFSPDGDRAALALESPVVLAVGALEPLKRMDVVIRAVKQWGRGSLLLVGDGPQRDALCALGTNELGPGRFHWKTAEPGEMPALYRAADVMVSASRSEAFGLVYLEALACGLPVVTQDDSVRREVLGDQGHFVDAGEPVAIAAVLDHALSSGSPSARVERARTFDTAIMAERYRELMVSLMPPG